MVDEITNHIKVFLGYICDINYLIAFLPLKQTNKKNKTPCLLSLALYHNLKEKLPSKSNLAFFQTCAKPLKDHE